MRLKSLIIGCVFLVPMSCLASDNAAPPGFVEGHLKIISPREVELANGTPASISAESYAEYPLIILSQDKNGNYRAPLPPGNYVLDVQGRAPGHVRAKPQRFTVVPNQTVRVDIDIDTGVRSGQSFTPRMAVGSSCL
jgi:hypothetical protein